MRHTVADDDLNPVDIEIEHRAAGCKSIVCSKELLQGHHLFTYIYIYIIINNNCKKSTISVLRN